MPRFAAVRNNWNNQQARYRCRFLDGIAALCRAKTRSLAHQQEQLPSWSWAEAMKDPTCPGGLAPANAYISTFRTAGSRY
jgi:hypothetical protein